MYVEMVHPDALSPADLDEYLARGWYRMVQSIFTCRFVMMRGNVYSAMWLRLPLSDYRFKKSLRRRMTRNANKFRIEMGPVALSKEKERLYNVYRKTFPADLSPSLEISLYGGSDRRIFDTHEFRVYDVDRLIACSFFDKGAKGLQSVLGIYDPEYSQHSLGLHTMLLEIQYGVEGQYTYFYPGYVAPGYPTFDYKLRIGDVEAYDTMTGQWVPFSHIDQSDMPDQQLSEGLSKLDHALEQANIPHELKLYPPFRLSGLDERLENFLTQPLFYECFPGHKRGFCLGATYVYETQTFHLDVFLRMHHPNLAEQLGDPNVQPGGPEACMDLLQRVIRMGETQSASAIARLVEEVGGV